MKNLKQLRKEQNETQEETAYALGMQQSTFQKYEAGARGKKVISDLTKMAAHYDVSIDYLIGRSVVRDGVEDEDIQLAYRIRRLHSDKARKAILDLIDEIEQNS